MGKYKFSKEELANLKVAAEDFQRLLSLQVVEINKEVLDLVVDKVVGKDLPEVKCYLESAKEVFENLNYSWNNIMIPLNSTFGYNPDTEAWDGEYYTNKEQVCTEQDIGDKIPVGLSVTGIGGLFGYTATGFDIISKEDFLEMNPVYADTDGLGSASALSYYQDDFEEVVGVEFSNWEFSHMNKFYTLVSPEGLVALTRAFSENDKLYVYNGC